MNGILKREKWRILSNYARLFAGLMIGLLVTRFLLGAGDSLFSIYTTITVGMGISIMLTELLRMGIVPVLGQHVSDGRIEDVPGFRGTLTAAFMIAAGAALFGVLVMAILGWFLLPSVGSPELVRAAWIFLILRMVMMVVVVALTPALSVLLVSGRQPTFNLFLFLERLSELIGVVLPLFLLAFLPDDQPSRLVQIGVGVTICTILTHVCAATVALRSSPDCAPYMALPERARLMAILTRKGWSSVQTLSMSLFTRFDILFVALVLGPVETITLGVAVRMMGYVRQATIGLVNGLDAAFANLSGQKRRKETNEKEARALGTELLSVTTSLQAIGMFQLSVLVLLLSEQIVRLWIGDVLVVDDPAASIREIAALTPLMVIGLGIRSLNLGWMSAMTGNGDARRFTPWLLPGAILNVVTLVGWYLLSPDTFSVMVIGWAFLILQGFTHILIMPIVASRVLDIPLPALLKPMLTPLLVALATLTAGYSLMQADPYIPSSLQTLGVLVLVLAGLGIGTFETLRRSRMWRSKG